MVEIFSSIFRSFKAGIPDNVEPHSIFRVSAPGRTKLCPDISDAFFPEDGFWCPESRIFAGAFAGVSDGRLAQHEILKEFKTFKPFNREAPFKTFKGEIR
jgi:hypothetical protein